MTDTASSHLALSPRASLVLSTIGLIVLAAALVPVLASNSGALFLVALFGGVAAIGLMSRPHWGVFVILVTQSLEMAPSVFSTARFLAVPYLVGAALMIPFCMGILRDGEIRILRIPQIRMLLAIGMLYLVSTGWSAFRDSFTPLPELDKTRWLLIAFFARLAFLVCFVSFVTTVPRIELAAWLIVAGITVQAVNSWGALVAEGRAASDFGYGKNPNHLAFMCLLATALVWSFRMYGPSRWWKGLLLPLLFFLPGVALATGSRSGLLQAAALGGFTLKHQPGGGLSRRVWMVVLVGCAALVLLAFIPSWTLERTTNFDPASDAPGRESLRNRVTQLHAAVKLFAGSPFLGIGIGNFETIVPTVYEMGRGVHNSYLNALTEGGVGVFALYIALFLITYFGLNKLEATGPPEMLWLSKGVKAALMIFLIASITADLWVSDHLYLILGLAIAMTTLPRGHEAVAAGGPRKSGTLVIPRR